MDCKINKDLDLEQIISVSEQKNQQERFQQQKDHIDLNFQKEVKKRNATISFIDSKKQIDDRFIH